jgi:propanediol dehydratase small subunit
MQMTKQTHTYPLMEHAGDRLAAGSGRALREVTLDAATHTLRIDDIQIGADTLHAQATIARQAGYSQLADNLERAAELAGVPNDDILRMYELLRPGRASYDELATLAAQLEAVYAAPTCAAMVREAAEVYQLRGILRR